MGRTTNQTDARVYVNLTQLKDMAYSCLVLRIPMLVFGAPGIGKTETFRAFGRQYGSLGEGVFGFEDALVLPTTEYNPLDFGGLYQVKDGWTRRAPAEILREADKKPILLIIDEISDAQQHEIAAWYRVIHEKQVGEFKLHKDSWVVSCGNRPEHSHASRDPAQPFQMRCTVANLKADYKAYTPYAVRQGWDHRVASFMNAYGTRYIDDGFDINCPYYGCNPRGLERLSRFEVAGVFPEDRTAALALTAGCIGVAAAGTYIAHREIDMPKPELVFESPKTAPVFSGDDELAKQMLYGSAVVSKASSAAEFGAILEYCARDDNERVRAGALCRDAISKDEQKCQDSPHLKECMTKFWDLL